MKFWWLNLLQCMKKIHVHLALIGQYYLSKKHVKSRISTMLLVCGYFWIHTVQNIPTKVFDVRRKEAVIDSVYLHWCLFICCSNHVMCHHSHSSCLVSQWPTIIKHVNDCHQKILWNSKFEACIYNCKQGPNLHILCFLNPSYYCKYEILSSYSKLMMHTM